MGEGGGERRGSHPRPPVSERRGAEDGAEREQRRDREQRGRDRHDEALHPPIRAERTAHDERGAARDAAHRRSGRQQEEGVEVSRDDEQQRGNGDAEQPGAEEHHGSGL